MSQDIVHIEDSWKQALVEEFKKPYFKNLSAFIYNEYAHHTVYPKSKDMWETPGQPGQSHFSGDGHNHSHGEHDHAH